MWCWLTVPQVLPWQPEGADIEKNHFGRAFLKIILADISKAETSWVVNTDLFRKKIKNNNKKRILGVHFTPMLVGGFFVHAQRWLLNH